MKKILIFALMGFLSFIFGGCGDHRQQAEGDRTISQLNWFEIEITPHEFRIGIGPDKPGLIAYKPTGSDQCQTSIFLPESNHENFALILKSLESFLGKLEIVNIPQHEPDKFSLIGAARDEPAMYLRFVCGDRVWQSRFSTNEIPPKIQALYEDCRALAIKVCEQNPRRQLSPEEAVDISNKRIGQ